MELVLIVVLVALLENPVFGSYVSPRWAAGIGALFIVARAIYAVGYRRAAEKRFPGAGLTVLVVLVVGSLIGLVRAML
jgi:hypothetical protein